MSRSTGFVLVFSVVLIALSAAAFSSGPMLFPTDLPVSKWVEFSSAGFDSRVSGVIYNDRQAPCCGVPVGGVGTGSIDVDPKGIYGFSTIFNPVSDFAFAKGWPMARKLPKGQPILGISVDGKTYVLATSDVIRGKSIPWCTEPYGYGEHKGQKQVIDHIACAKIEGVQPAREIHYWGHYPVADMEFETGGPIKVAMRAWAPFLPGESATSNTPAAFFEVHLRNDGKAPKNVTLAMNFPGPDAEEAKGTLSKITRIDEGLHGIRVASNGGVEYFLGVVGNEKARIGAGLAKSPGAWSKIAQQLPDRSSADSSASMAVDFALRSGESKVVRFVLTWYAPVWEGSNSDLSTAEKLQNFGTRWIPADDGGSVHYFTHMYAARYENALDVAQKVAPKYDSLLSRVLAWQRVVYSDNKLPVWLRDSLINNLCCITQDGYWAQAKSPLGDWAAPNGVFGMFLSARAIPVTSCIPCDFYGNLPIVYLFPDLARTTLDAYKHYQRDDGAAPFALGKTGGLPDFATPAYNFQISLNGTCYVALVDRLWRRTGDDGILREFYGSVKKCNTFTMNMVKGPDGVITMPEGDTEWFAHDKWMGMCAHMGGLRLAQLRIMARMAEAMGDKEYAEQCRSWFEQGSRSMENKLWTGRYYLNFWAPEKGVKSDEIMGYQLDGEWMARFHGVEGAFKPDRVKTTLRTIRECNIALTPKFGAANFTRPDGSPVAMPKGIVGQREISHDGAYSMFCAEVAMLGMTYIQAGERDLGMDLVRRHWEDLVCTQRHPFDFPNRIGGETGRRTMGTNVYQAMMLWGMPAVVEGADISSPCGPDGLVTRMIAAASGREVESGK